VPERFTGPIEPTHTWPWRSRDHRSRSQRKPGRNRLSRIRRSSSPGEAPAAASTAES